MAAPENILPERPFTPMPLGTVQPRGWLKEQLVIQSKGLSDTIDELFPSLGPDNSWLGGKEESGDIGAYFLDGIVHLAFLLDEKKLKEKAELWVNRVLALQQKDGWLGQTSEYPEYRWQRAAMLTALSHYADATGDQRIITSIAAYFAHMRNSLQDVPLAGNGKFRWGEYLLPLLWLCGKRPCPVFAGIPLQLRTQGYNWVDHFEYFNIESAVDNAPTMTNLGIHNAMAMKYPALWGMFSGDPSTRKLSVNAATMLERFHGLSGGAFTSDNHLAGKNPSRGTDISTVTEQMNSLEVLTSLLGGTDFADKLEMLAYNILPAAFTDDMKAVQRVQQVNQVKCSIGTRPGTAGNDASIFGVKIPGASAIVSALRGLPVFVSNMWMRTPGGGFAAVAYGPSEMTTVIGDTRVTITEETDYPFRGKIELRIRSSASISFPLSLRIPAWAEGALLSQNGDVPYPVKPGKFITIEKTWKKKESIVLEFPMKLRSVAGYNNAVTLMRGPLVFSLGIDDKWDIISGDKKNPDFSVTPESPWNYSLIGGPGQSFDNCTVEEKSVKMPCFSPDKAPVVITAKARKVSEWGMDGSSASPPPTQPQGTPGVIEDITLIPYGAANLRITEFPLDGV